MIKSELDTIAAIATPIGEGGISVLRLSGSEAITVAASLFKGGKDLRVVQSHTAHHGMMTDSDSQPLDEAVCTVFRGPHSYTGEDVVEISCHGGMLITKRILEAILNTGVRQAEPGEFTKRAFLNGKLDLTQAEAVGDLIHAKSDSARAGSLRQLQGGLSEEIRGIRTQIVDSIGLLELELDFSEDGYELADKEAVRTSVDAALDKLRRLIVSYRQGKVVRDGAKVVLVGAPNVGKSSLLNRLLSENRAIVTSIPGTTRDVIEESIEIDGVLLRLVDTAGLRETPDPIEEEGIRRTNSQMESADLVLFILDGTRRIDESEKLEFERVKLRSTSQGFETLLVVNKIDVDPKLSHLNGFASSALKISATENIGVQELKDRMLNSIHATHDSTQQSLLVTNSRHYQALRKAAGALEEAKESLRCGRTSEFIVLDLRVALDSLGEIVGEVTTDEILVSVFSKFCIGK